MEVTNACALVVSGRKKWPSTCGEKMPHHWCQKGWIAPCGPSLVSVEERVTHLWCQLEEFCSIIDIYERKCTLLLLWVWWIMALEWCLWEICPIDICDRKSTLSLVSMGEIMLQCWRLWEELYPIVDVGGGYPTIRRILPYCWRNYGHCWEE